MHIYSCYYNKSNYIFLKSHRFLSAWCSIELVNHSYYANHTYSRVTSDEERMMGFALHGPKYLADREVCGDISVTNQSGMNTTRTILYNIISHESYLWPLFIIFSFIFSLFLYFTGPNLKTDACIIGYAL